LHGFIVYQTARRVQRVPGFLFAGVSPEGKQRDIFSGILSAKSLTDGSEKRRRLNLHFTEKLIVLSVARWRKLSLF
jgi:hypothetical protein